MNETGLDAARGGRGWGVTKQQTTKKEVPSTANEQQIKDCNTSF